MISIFQSSMSKHKGIWPRLIGIFAAISHAKALGTLAGILRKPLWKNDVFSI
ncbi:hypothetical protein [Nitrobacter sp.]|uniref:hypothetical protein n=1 Tax=Nitrobacter sp. TaxID=29420 RepID=UPI00399D661E